MKSMKDLIESKEILWGAFLSEIAAPNVLRVMKAAGIQFVIVDCEHGAFDYSQVSALAAVANGLRLPIIIRIPCIAREHILKYLDAGADGILAPMTETVEAAQKLIELGKYAPLGSRGISLMRPHSEYNPGEINSYMDKANRRTLFFAQIETDIGVQNAEKIAAVEGIDGLLMGPNDLAADYGLPGVFDNPKMESAIQKVIKAAEKSNKPSGIISSKIDFLRKCKAMGMTIFSCNSEVGLLYQGAKRAKYEFFAD